ncbi:hypothetical protein MQC82_04570 [Pseudomonas viridiflava]|uniref:hypothetical protein n=1 Tax=Pseudomonas viridiflava TaxID=33069 RepID=UPI001F61879C|nr:hypothetical protein [Pseudomonas viridiflava]MCI3908833.1 hypothetical protein [Pseudomonas viridiflava]
MNVEAILEFSDNSAIKISFLQDVAPSYNVFCDLVEAKILEAVYALEHQKPLYHNLGEDQLTGILVIGLKVAGLDAEHDTFRNGHVDILVKNGRYEWLAEAKLDDGPAYIMDGFRQLADRYSDGAPTGCRGGLLIYTKKTNKVSFMDGWLNHLSANYEVPVTRSIRCSDTLTSYTSHAHHATGIEYRVKHFAVSMYYNPTDKSARKAKGKLAPT